MLQITATFDLRLSRKLFQISLRRRRRGRRCARDASCTASVHQQTHVYARTRVVASPDTIAEGGNVERVAGDVATAVVYMAFDYEIEAAGRLVGGAVGGWAPERKRV